MSSSVKNDQSAKYTKVSESMLGHFLSALGQESGEAPMTYLTQLCSNGTKLEELLACNTSPGLLFPNWKIPLSLSLCLFIHVVRPFRMVILRNQIKRAFGSTSPSSTEKHYLNVFSLSFFPFLFFFSFEPELWCSLPPPPVEPSLEAANWADWKHLCYLEATVLCMSLHPVVLRY